MLEAVMPIGRMGTADEVAGAILFFASDDSSLCQGAVLSVDGGFTAQ
jgi:NAD(P)-dependent dehydrogenase (short-subunit alcohol dehydrogenase family)